jgi:hypothetical protein
MCEASWDTHGAFFYLSFPAIGDPNTYVLLVRASSGLPDLPAEGVGGPDDLKPNSRVSVIPVEVDWATGPDFYSYTRFNTVRNIYRIPLP